MTTIENDRGRLAALVRELGVVHERVGIIAIVRVARKTALHIHRDAAAIDDEGGAEHLGHPLLHPMHGFIFVAVRFHDETKGAAAEVRQ